MSLRDLLPSRVQSPEEQSSEDEIKTHTQAFNSDRELQEDNLEEDYPEADGSEATEPPKT